MTRQEYAWQVGPIRLAGSYMPLAGAKGRLACPHQPPHVGRHSRQVKTSQSNLSKNHPGHHRPYRQECMGAEENIREAGGRLRNKREHHGYLQSTSTNRPSQVWAPLVM
jgi:hypothetical protein